MLTISSLGNIGTYVYTIIYYNSSAVLDLLIYSMGYLITYNRATENKNVSSKREELISQSPSVLY